jgi:glycosyltransferase involved in cell wall biosynthesis
MAAPDTYRTRGVRGRSAATAPDVSVVVATRDRPARLAALLAGLRSQLLDGTFEVIVVDDGSGPATAAQLRAEAARGGLDLHVVRLAPARGPGAARNAGWRTARAGLIAFTDDDCVPAPGWLAAGVRAHRADPRALVQGRTEPEPAERHRAGITLRTLRVTALGPQYPTCNIFYPRVLLDRLNGFDEDFGTRPGGEDTDLAWRAIEHGAAPALAADAIVYHAVERLGALGMLREATRWTATTRIFARHPQLRATLNRRLFWNVWHYLLVRSLLAVLLPRGLRRFVWRRHARALRRRAREAGAGAWAVPLLLAYDALETVAVARGGWRHRTPVL